MDCTVKLTEETMAWLLSYSKVMGLHPNVVAEDIISQDLPFLFAEEGFTSALGYEPEEDPILLGAFVDFYDPCNNRHVRGLIPKDQSKATDTHCLAIINGKETIIPKVYTGKAGECSQK